MYITLMALAISAQAATAEVRVDAVQANWSAFPRLERVPRALPTPAMVGRVEEILKECRIPGQSSNRFDFDVPFGVLLQPDGSTNRVIVQDTGCPELETYVGEIVLLMAEMGDFRSTGQSEVRWHADTLNFNLE